MHIKNSKKTFSAAWTVQKYTALNGLMLNLQRSISETFEGFIASALN